MVWGTGLDTLLQMHARRIAGVIVCLAALVSVAVLSRRAMAARAMHELLVERRALIARRDIASANGDAVGVAVMNGRLAHEALLRALATHDAWMEKRNPKTGLFPRSAGRPVWNYKDTGADFFCFQYAASRRFGLASLPLLKGTLAREREASVTLGYSSALDAATGEPVKTPAFERLFGPCEYLKDGLVGLYETTGDDEVLARMREIADGIIGASSHRSRFGTIPGPNTEMNGDVLQAFSRLYFVTGDDRYAEFAGRIGDAVVAQMLANTGGLPVQEYDYEHDTFPSSVVWLRDHGNEAAVGLSEAFALAVARGGEPAWDERAARWSGPLAGMFETLLTAGVREDGLLVDKVDGRTHAQLATRACDNWGYLAASALLYVEAEQRRGEMPATRLDGIVAGVDRVALAVAGTDGVDWEDGHFDGYADSVESAIYVASRRPEIRARLLAWADDQIGRMFAAQQPDGTVGGGYLDGNFIRTSMMYADARTGGWRLEPWSATASVGMGWAPGSEPVVVVTAGPDGYRGTLTPDTARHKSRLHLPWDWSRINCWPEWCVAEQEGGGVVVELAPGERRVVRMSEVAVMCGRVP